MVNEKLVLQSRENYEISHVIKTIIWSKTFVEQFIVVLKTEINGLAQRKTKANNCNQQI